MRKLCWLPLLSLSLILSSCATVGTGSSPLSKLAARDVSSSADVGSILGAIGGGVIGNNVPKIGRNAGIFWGSQAGRLLGQEIGKVAANRRLKYATEAQFLDSEIAASKQAISSKERGIVSLRQDLTNTRNETSRLEAKNRSNIDVTAEAGRALNRVESAIARNNKLIGDYEVAIQYINEIIANSRSASAKERGLESKRNTLYAERDELREQVRQLHGLNDGNEAVQTRLIRLTRGRANSGGSSRANPLDRFVPSQLDDVLNKIPFNR